MKKRLLMLFSILLIAANACSVSDNKILPTEVPEINTSEITPAGLATPKAAPTEIITSESIPKNGLYENDLYSLTIPEGWGLNPTQGEHFDLGVKKNITLHNDTNAKESVAFFTVSSATLMNGETLKSHFDQAYKKGPEIEIAVIKPFEREALTGIDITYSRPWGEPRWIFHDVWLEKDGVVYVLTSQSYFNTFETHAQTFASILDSFSFKQSQAEVTEIPEVKTTAFPLPPSTARIAFSATGWTVPRSREEIFVMNTDGTGITALSNSQGDDRDPAWSPDGKFLAFTSDRDANTEVYIMNADGSNQTRVTNSPENEHHPEWSPDGQLIVFSRTMADNSGDLFVTNLDGSNLTRLTDTPKRDEAYPDWSPDGTQIVFSAFGASPSGIFVMNSDGSNVRSIMTGPLHFPKWSPDGKYFAFDGEPGDCHFEVYIMRVDGSEMRKITDHPGGCGEYNKSPSWSPDGKQLVYSSTGRNSRPGVDIYIINVDGSGETALTHGKTDLHNGGFYPSWSPLP